MREEAEATQVWSPGFLRSLETVWQGNNEESTGQIRLCYPKPIAEKIEYTGSIARVGRQEGGCPMDCRLKTRDGHYHLALGAV